MNEYAYPDHSLLNKENITSEFEWASSIGIKGVKVDYYESDNQAAMNQMYLCADIAADNELMVLFHGCTNPGGENRTYHERESNKRRCTDLCTCKR